MVDFPHCYISLPERKIILGWGDNSQKHFFIRHLKPPETNVTPEIGHPKRKLAPYLKPFFSIPIWSHSPPKFNMEPENNGSQ